jgi:hypothetical protein
MDRLCAALNSAARNETVAANVLCFENRAHTSAAEAFHDTVVPEGLFELRILLSMCWTH